MKKPLPHPLIGLIMAGFVLLTGTAARAGECAVAVSRDTILERGAFGELRLASGRVVVLSDVRVAGHVEEVSDFLASRLGAEIELRLRGTVPDRWGRLQAAVIVAPDASRLDLAHALVARGLAVVDTSSQNLCDAGLLLREEQARRARRGVWRAEEVLPVPATDADALLARVGGFTIVEGVVESVGERGRRTYLDFSRARDGAFTVIIAGPLRAKMRDAGMDVATLKDRRIRVRGIMQNWRGPAIEITTVEFIEKLESRPLRP